MEDFKKALEGTLGRKHIDNIVDQVAGSPDRFDALYTLTQHEETKIAWHATWACEKLSILLPSLLMDKREELMLQLSLISAFKACCLLPKAHPDKLSA